jgi:hypothetical protein
MAAVAAQLAERLQHMRTKVSDGEVRVIALT